MKQNEEKKLLPWREAYRINRKAIKLIFHKYPKMIVSRIVCVIWEALTPYVGIYLSARLIEEISGGRDADRLAALALLILALSAGISLVSAILGKWRDTENTGMFFKLEQILAEKMMEMDFASADDTKTHELLSTIRQNQNGGGWGLWPVVRCCEEMASDGMKLAGGVALTVSLFVQPVPESGGALTVLNNPLFILLVIGVLLAVTYLAPALSNKAGSYYALHADSHNLGNRLFGFFGFLGYNRQLAADVRIYRQDLLCEKYNNNKYDTFCSKGMFARFARGPVGLYGAASAAVSMVFIGCVYVFVCLKSWAGAFGVGDVTQYIGAITLLSGSVSSLISTAGSMRNNAPFVRLIFDFLEIPGRMRSGNLPVKKGDCTAYEIEFRNVSFRYPGSADYSLREVSMKFHPGERLAVVGENGSGKTTFIKLLCRLYDPTEGEILLNGIDIREYDYAEYMGLFSVVFQDFSLYAFTLGQNVGTRVAYDRALAQACLEKAGFGERLGGMEKGTETYLYKDFSKEGVDVSGGEAQKIALARSLYRDVPFIVLDEPTAALDPIAEAEVYGRFNDMVGSKTAVYISHRLSSCRFCSDIAVFQEGRLVQRGSHESLAADRSGKYYELWNAQAQYYAAQG